jgi:ribonuclease HI
MEIIKCYCDASYDPISKTAVTGWKIGSDPICIKKIKNTNNTRAEIIGIISLIENLDPFKNYIIYTDCQGILERLASKENLIRKNFKNNKGIELANCDIYQQLFDAVTDNIIIKHINGHMPTKIMNDDNIIFSMVDKYVRKALRKIV